MTSKEVGEIAEVFVLARLISLGFTVSIPWGDSARYDLILDDESKLYRVQVKTGRLQNGCVVFNANSVNLRTQTRSNYVGDADYFAVYVEELGNVYLIPITEELPTSEVTLRLIPTKNSQEKGIRWAKDFEI